MMIIKASAVLFALLAFFLWLTPADRWPTLLLLAACAWLSLDSLLEVSVIGTRYRHLSEKVFGVFHRQVAWLALILYLALSILLTAI